MTPSYLEAIAIFESTRQWRPLVLDRKFTVVTDHQVLVSLPTRKSAQDWLTHIQLSMMNFSYKIMYRQGEDNVMPNALSRIPRDQAEEGPDPAEVLMDPPERTLQAITKRWQGLEV